MVKSRCSFTLKQPAEIVKASDKDAFWVPSYKRDPGSKGLGTPPNPLVKVENIAVEF